MVIGGESVCTVCTWLDGSAVGEKGKRGVGGRDARSTYMIEGQGGFTCVVDDISHAASALYITLHMCSVTYGVHTEHIHTHIHPYGVHTVQSIRICQYLVRRIV